MCISRGTLAYRNGDKQTRRQLISLINNIESDLSLYREIVCYLDYSFSYTFLFRAFDDITMFAYDKLHHEFNVMLKKKKEKKGHFSYSSFYKLALNIRNMYHIHMINIIRQADVFTVCIF